MKITIPRKVRKYLIIYLALLVFLFLVIEFIPKITTAFETTEILEPGELQISCDAEGYFVKDEAIAVADVSGKVVYRQVEGSVVRKGLQIVEMQPVSKTEGMSRKYSDLMARLEGFEGISKGGKSPISGIYSLTMDGYEKSLSPKYLDSLTYDQIKEMSLIKKSLKQDSALAGEPIFKITNDARWYLLCWMSEKKAHSFTEGQKVGLELPAGSVQATVMKITPDKRNYKVVLSSTMYYKDLEFSREADVKIVNSDSSGLLISNSCIIEKHGREGVYVRNKNGDYRFVPVNVISTDGERSIVSETSYYDAKGRTVSTVSVYDEVLKNPKRALKKDLKAEEKAREEEKRKAEEEATRASSSNAANTKKTENATKAGTTSVTKPTSAPATNSSQPPQTQPTTGAAQPSQTQPSTSAAAAPTTKAAAPTTKATAKPTTKATAKPTTKATKPTTKAQ